MAVEFLHELNVPFFKVGSGDTNNFPYLEKTAKKGKCLIFVIKSKGVQTFVFTPLLASKGGLTKTDFRNLFVIRIYLHFFVY